MSEEQDQLLALLAPIHRRQTRLLVAAALVSSSVTDGRIKVQAEIDEDLRCSLKMADRLIEIAEKV